MRTIQISVLPEHSVDSKFIEEKIKDSISLKEEFTFKVLKKSIDARAKTVKINLKIAIFQKGEQPTESKKKQYQNVSNSKSVIIVGFGPAGMFAALKLIERDIKPIIIERGKDVRSRRRDLAAITKNHLVNSESNYCFGEGGAGTYSDGKLYTRSKKRGDVNEILQILVQHGATEEILVDAHPHIGTNKLPKVVSQIRETIEKSGGEIHFNTKLIDIIIEKNKVKGISTSKGGQFFSDHVILATGHYARDIFYLLDKKGIEIVNKPFALGVRVEHPQELIDSIQYHTKDRGEHLPAASYQLVAQVRNRGVFSFCMCPGGIIAPCATAPGEIVTNGW